MADSLEYILACQICMEDFKESGDHVPRILPCSHTLCQGCLKQEIRDKSVKCPECQVQHATGNNERSFPQNKYLLINIRRKASKTKGEPTNIKVCEEHGKEVTLFCRETGCKKPICPICLTKQHRKHDIVDIGEGQKEMLMTSVNEVISNLQIKKLKLSVAQSDLEKNNDNCITQIKNTRYRMKSKIDEVCEKLIKEALKQNKKVNEDITQEIEGIDDNLVLLSSIVQNTDNETVTPEDMRNHIEVVTDDSQKNFSGIKTYRYPIYGEDEIGGPQLEKMCGTIVQGMMEVNLHSTIPEENLAVVTNASQIECTGILMHCEKLPIE